MRNTDEGGWTRENNEHRILNGEAEIGGRSCENHA